ncbi:MAG: GTP cyclohydrolase I FolE2, partial [Proteobacteria bacterium]|nr:GTP cyclohydrolase I FolE2 [Pseudomonadota bacterium]
NIAQAIQWMRQHLTIKQVSSCYETEPVGYLEQPDFINIACQAATELSPHELLRFLKRIERQMGRQNTFRNSPRPIDIDILLYNDLVLDTPELIIPHPRMAERAFVLVPLADIGPAVKHPVLGVTVAELVAQVGRGGLRPAQRCLSIMMEKDVQESIPQVQVSLSRVGVTNLERIIRIVEDGKENLFHAHIDLFVDLLSSQAGVHMSRFTDILEQIIEEITVEKSPDIETMAERLAQQVVESQRAARAEVRIKAVYPMMKIAPISAKPTQELYTLIGIAVAFSPKSDFPKSHSRRLVGIEAEGLTVCPCAQDMVRSYSRQLLLEEGISADIANKVLELIPIASHNQRGRGTLLIGSQEKIQGADLVSIVENAMSSEI